MVSGPSDGLGDARKHRRALAASQHQWVGRSSELGFADHGKHVLDVAWLAEGPGAGAELDLGDDSRPTQWVLDLENEARRLSICETGAVLLWDVGNQRWRARSLGCNCRLCPVCSRVRAARACGRWRAVLEAAAADGAVLRHWTLTQPVIMAPGGLVTPAEARRGYWVGAVAADGVRARAVGGEGLGSGYRRLRGALTALRENAATRDIVRAAFGGLLVGCEWTGRDPGTGIPRWHVHAHLLGCTPAGVHVDEQAVLRAWCKLTGGSMRAQHVRLVDATDEKSIGKAIAEVLKYPFKPAGLTSAQRIETLAWMRGMHPHHISGAWSPLSKARKEDPCWSRWLEARPETPEYLRLHHIPDVPGAVPELWTGSPAEGLATWAVRRAGSKTVDNPEEQGWRVWEADAAGYAALLGDDPELGGVVPELEPGSDLDEDWFRT